MKIYTKTGDKGKTNLVNGKRVSKSNSRIDLYGDVDELNSSIGLFHYYLKELHSHCKDEILGENLKMISLIQNELFVLGSLLACESKDHQKFHLRELVPNLIPDMENLIDQMDLLLPSLRNFILPSGSLAALYAHQSRCITRRLERKIFAYIKKKPNEISENSLIFINRLSDYFFQVSRYSNFCLKISEDIWQNKKAT